MTGGTECHKLVIKVRKVAISEYAVMEFESSMVDSEFSMSSDEVAKGRTDGEIEMWNGLDTTREMSTLPITAAYNSVIASQRGSAPKIKQLSIKTYIYFSEFIWFIFVFNV